MTKEGVLVVPGADQDVLDKINNPGFWSNVCRTAETDLRVSPRPRTPTPGF